MVNICEMVKNNKNNKQAMVTGRRRLRRKNRGGEQTSLPPTYLSEGVFGGPMRMLSFSPANPGRVFLRGTVELFNGNAQYYFSYQSFGTWFGQARSVLTPFAMFRVNNARVSVKVSGGTASAHSVVFNVSNTYLADTGGVGILNDDYSGIASAAMCPYLQPPKSYWREGNRTWYVAVDPTSGVPTEVDIIAGSVSVNGSGGLTSGTVIGWVSIELELEFHTLL